MNWHSRAPAHSCSDRCSIDISRVTCRSIRSRKPCCGPRTAGKSTDGGTNGARDRRCSVLRGPGESRRTATTSTRRCAGWSASTTTSRDGEKRSVRSTNRCGWGRIRICRLRRRRWRRSRPTRGRPPRLQVRLFGLFGPNGPLPLHITEYARERLRHAGDPTLSRFLDVFHHRFLALFYRAWAQAQPHVNRDRPKEDRFTTTSARSSGCRRRRFAAATRCRIWRSSFTSAR